MLGVALWVARLVGGPGARYLDGARLVARGLGAGPAAGHGAGRDGAAGVPGQVGAGAGGGAGGGDDLVAGWTNWPCP
jgi:hypothetical protein